MLPWHLHTTLHFSLREYLIDFIDDRGELKRLIILAEIRMTLPHDCVIRFLDLSIVSIASLHGYKGQSEPCTQTRLGDI